MHYFWMYWGDGVSFRTIYYCLISNYIYRGDHIVPNFEEIWPSGKTKDKPKAKFDMDYLMDAMNKGIPGERNKDFTTCGKPKVSFFFNFIRNMYCSTTIHFYIFQSCLTRYVGYWIEILCIHKIETWDEVMRKKFWIHCMKVQQKFLFPFPLSFDPIFQFSRCRHPSFCFGRMIHSVVKMEK